MSLSQGMSFGFITGITTTLGVLIGMYSNTKSHKIVILSVLLLALSDGFAESYGMYTSLKKESKKEKYEALMKSILLFVSKVIVSCILILPFMLMSYSERNIPTKISIALAVLGILIFSRLETASKSFYVFIARFMIHIIILTLICGVTFGTSVLIDKI